MRKRTWALQAAALATATAAWGVAETHMFRLRHRVVPVLPRDADPITVLHISDLHMQPGQKHKIRWVQDLSRLQPDLLINTGDNLGHRDGIDPVLEALLPFAGTPGVFVLGSNDFFAPRMPHPWKYLLEQGSDAPRTASSPRIPTDSLVRVLEDLGWHDLNNARHELAAGRIDVDFVGTGDPHLGYDEYSRVGRPARGGDVITMGVTHAPYTRVLDAMTGDGVDMIFAGHTHGGQLCLPGGRAIVTNCDLPRRYAKGLHRWTSQNATSANQSESEAWLHVSAGLGAAPMVPVRFMCPPEATLLQLMPRCP